MRFLNTEKPAAYQTEGRMELPAIANCRCITVAQHTSVLPNAGLPRNEGGRAVYDLKPQELADYHKQFITEYGVRVVGGCCGTNPAYIKAVYDTCANLEPAKRNVKAGLM